MTSRPQDIFEEITSYENIRLAYFDLVKKFDESIKSSRYVGIDGIKINDINFISDDILVSVRDELINFKDIVPPHKILIPKKGGQYRSIYTFTVKERIKAEAIYRIIEPIFDQYVSEFLYSYRSSHPAYFAARSATRRYKRFYGENHVLIADMSDYTDSIDRNLLVEQLKLLDLDEKTRKLIELFVWVPYVDKGVSNHKSVGLLTGTPISGLLSNLFMDDFDKEAGKLVAFYRRVGDDMIAIDKDIKKIQDVHDLLVLKIKEKKLILNKKKLKIVPDTEVFEFLGYQFSKGQIGFSQKSLDRMISDWKKELYRYRGASMTQKKRHYLAMFENEKNTIFNRFKQIVRQKILVDDLEQIEKFSEKFFIVLTSYFYGQYSDKKRRQLSTFLKNNKIVSLRQHYSKMRHTKSYEK